ncbi:NAD(P)H-hydrate dehydratase [Desulfolucanica intricata]|uniref:NAD(P)H-hydrate dehydratase n=1 Tax=Desulfolucanica intricata TaxID=1285191 RepID=UPI0008340886|nr:NAD(P)H-hydrate dehydratase [Desulfolucanica intricata]
MQVVTAGEMGKLDRMAIERYGIPGIVLMENAGKQVVQVVANLFEQGVRNKKVVIFIGKGNNGGDGFVVARHLYNLGAGVEILLFTDPLNISGDAAVNLNIWTKMGQAFTRVDVAGGIELAKEAINSADVLVDALYGTGFRGVVKEPAASIIEMANNSGRPIVAVDIPSGVEADTGRVNGPCFRANHTVTFALPKLGLLLEPGAAYTGKLHVVDISIPNFLLEGEEYKRYLLEAAMVKKWLPHRSASVHKGDCGRVLILAGSQGMTGAAYLTAQAAARAGAGLVTLGVPAGVHDIMEAKLTEVMTVPLPQTEKKTLAAGALSDIQALLKKADVLALGPGLSTHPETVALVHSLMSELKIPTVIDADGLNALAGELNRISGARCPLILTPHPGEMARLINIPVGEVEVDRLNAVIQLALKGNCTVLLKGSRTLVSNGEQLYINSTGNPGMATGGSGDVLTGIIAALVAQGLDPVKAAAAGAYIHGLAGDLAMWDKGVMGLIAGDLITYLPEALDLIY